MKWKGSRESDNVEDRRSISGGKVAVGGGIIGIIILLVNVFGGENAQFITPVLEQMQGGQQTQTEAAAPLSKEDEEMGHFVRSVLAKTEDTWGKIFAENGMTYKNPKLVL
ncbi:MAG: neutral zinc metallopeptidase, partial [Flavobacterium sp.]